MTKSAVPTAWLVLSSLCVIPQKWLKLLCQVSADRFYQGDSRSCITWAISISYSLPPSHQVNQQILLTRVMASPQMSNIDLFKGLPGQVAVWQVKLAHLCVHTSFYVSWHVPSVILGVSTRAPTVRLSMPEGTWPAIPLRNWWREPGSLSKVSTQNQKNLILFMFCQFLWNGKNHLCIWQMPNPAKLWQDQT